MNPLLRIAGEAAVGLGLSIGTGAPLQTPENNPAHIALVHGSQDAETPAQEALVYVHTNRSERRFLRLAGEVWRAANSPEHTQLIEDLETARSRISDNARLNRIGRQ